MIKLKHLNIRWVFFELLIFPNLQNVSQNQSFIKYYSILQRSNVLYLLQVSEQTGKEHTE